MTAASAPTTVPRSLVWATDLDVLPLDRVIERRDGYLVARSPGNPDHYWGNLLLFDEPPSPGDGPRWERVFRDEFAGEPRVRHITLAWDRVDGRLGAAGTEFADRGYDLERTVGLVAAAEDVRPHARENPHVLVRSLNPAAGGDEELWAQVVELQVASRQEHLEEDTHRAFTRARQAEFRALFRAGRGAWYVAITTDGEVTGSCGVVVTSSRGRFQAVDTAAAHRRRGICSRLVVWAAHHAIAHHGARRFVIAADPSYHALGLYESLGFLPAEQVCGVCRRPG